MHYNQFVLFSAALAVLYTDRPTSRIIAVQVYTMLKLVIVISPFKNELSCMQCVRRLIIDIDNTLQDYKLLQQVFCLYSSLPFRFILRCLC